MFLNVDVLIEMKGGPSARAAKTLQFEGNLKCEMPSIINETGKFLMKFHFFFFHLPDVLDAS
jgi:hypothetical protein